MTTLADLQAQFQSFLFGKDKSIERLTVGTDRLPVSDRLGVYANAYRLRLLEILADDFPGVRGLMGGDAFEEMGNAYIDAHPSSHPSVRWFGRHLCAFLRNSPSCRGQPFLAEMAAFEWTQGEVLDAADAQAVTLDELSHLDPAAWPSMTIVFQYALRRLDLAWNIPAVWQAIHDEETPPELEQAEQPVPWLFWRLDMSVHWRSIDDDERYALDAAREGAPFGAICEGLLVRTQDDQVPLRAAGYLKRWVTDEAVARIDAE